MAQFKYAQYLNQKDHDEYDKVYSPGENCPNSGTTAATLLIQTRRAGYLESIAHLKVNPETGALEKR